jgi:hypothetical protein
METDIGTVAGLIWKLLNASGPLSITLLLKEIDASRDTVMQGLGWLAREGKIQIETEGRTKRVLLS